MTSKRLDLLRLDYSFSVLIPCLLAIFIHDLDIITNLDLLVGFSLLAITGSLLNDAIDRRHPDEQDTIARTRDYYWKELAALAIVSFFLGIFLFIKTVQIFPLNGLILGVIILFVVFYCLFKKIPILNLALLGISHIILPYLMILVNSNINILQISLGEVFLILSVFIFGLVGESVHEIIDEDATSKFSLGILQKIILIFSSITIILLIISGVLMQNYVTFAVIPIPIGVIYMFRKPNRPHKGVKDIGIIMGNLVMVVLIVLIIQNAN